MLLDPDPDSITKNCPCVPDVSSKHGNDKITTNSNDSGFKVAFQQIKVARKEPPPKGFYDT